MVYMVILKKIMKIIITINQNMKYIKKNIIKRIKNNKLI